MATYVDRSQANRQKLQEVDEVQDKTKEALARIQRQAAEAEETGTMTLEELRKQGQQMDEIHGDLEAVSAKLDTSAALQNRFDMWAGNWFGGKKRAALKEAAAEIAQRNADDNGKIKEVFENEKFDTLTRKWKPSGMTLVTTPTVAAPEIFDPSAESQQAEEATWKIDYSLNGIDAEGWTYADSFGTLNSRGQGEASAKWNHYVRRRKWRHQEKVTASSSALDEVRARNDARHTKSPSTPGSGASQAEKVGYVPRSRTAPVASGLTSTSMTRGQNNDPSQKLSAEDEAGMARYRQKDAEIDAGIDVVGRQIDNLTNLAGAMTDEVKHQTAKINKIEDAMQRATEKQTVVTARQKKITGAV